MEINQFPPTQFKSEVFPSRSHGSVEDLWKALFIPNVPLDSLFGSSEQDLKLGGISLLFQTTIFHIKDICLQLRKAEDETHKLRQELQLSEQSCEGLKDALKSATVSCKNCKMLQAQIAKTEAVHRSIFSLMSSARSTLGAQNGRKSQAEAQVEEAYKAVNQAIRETQDLLPTDEMMEDDFSPLAASWCTKQKRPADALFSPNEILSTPENQRLAKKQQRVRPRPTCDLLEMPPRIVIPETLENVENKEALSPVRVGGDAERTVLGDVSANVPTTPKKGITKYCDGSPILGKKSTKNGTPGRADNSCRDIFEDSPKVAKDGPDAPSPSLLNPKKVQDTKSEVKRMGSAKSGGSFESQPAQKIVKLDSVGCDVTLERRPIGGTKKMKQQKLSLKSFSRAKQDLTSLKEFNGGLRAQTSDLGVAEEESRLIEMAKQASILDEERRKKDEEEMLKQELSLVMLSQCDDDDDEVISATPQPSAAKKSGRQTAPPEKSKPDALTMTFEPEMMSTMLPKDSTMATFVPNFHSTENVETFVPKFHSTEREETFAPNFHSTERRPDNEPCTANSLLENLVDEMGQDDTFVPRQRFVSSFDRIPERKSDSPNYKYKGPAVRKKCERKKLCGRDCADCGEFLAQNQVDPNKVSRHRDVHGPISSTPRGFWNTSFPNSLREKP